MAKNSLIRRVGARVGLLLVLAVAFSMPLGGMMGGSVAEAADDTKTDAKQGDAGKKDDKKAAAQSQDAIQGHATDKQLQVGTMVQLAGNDTSKVQPAKFDKAANMYGVVIDKSNLSLTISNPDLQNQVYVATGGTYNVLVNTQNGAINTGDYVTISALDGVGMLAMPEQKTVFGRAAASFDGKSNVIGNATLKDTAGKEHRVAIGIIPVAIDIRRNPNEKSTKANLPQLLQRLGEAVAEKPVGPLRIYLSIAITGICIIAAIAILYSGIRNSIISIGRNPLSKKSIFRALLEIILTALIILIVGLFAVYLLLKL